jgi:hypothetical protein
MSRNIHEKRRARTKGSNGSPNGHDGEKAAGEDGVAQLCEHPSVREQ